MGTLTAMLLIGIVFSVVQIVTASTNPDPGHVLSQIQDIICGTGYCVQSITNGTLVCAACSGGGSGVGGSGTANYIAKWTAGSTIGNSQLVDNGQGVGVGSTPRQTPPGSGVYWPLDVYGSVHSDLDINADNRIRGAKVCIGGTAGSDTGCRTSWPTFSNLNCTRVSTGLITVSGYSKYAVQAYCPSGYAMVRCEWASISGKEVYASTNISLMPGYGYEGCGFVFDRTSIGDGQVTGYAYCCQ